MEIKIKHGTETVISLSGQLDTLSSPDLEKEIMDILEKDVKKVKMFGIYFIYY